MSENRGNEQNGQLFLLRLWLFEPPQAGGDHEQGGPSQGVALRWHGKVQHVVRGEAHAFTDRDKLLDCLEAMMLSDRAGSMEAAGSVEAGGT